MNPSKRTGPTMPADEYDQEEVERLRYELAQRPAPTGALDDTARREIEARTEALEAELEERAAQEQKDEELDELEQEQENDFQSDSEEVDAQGRKKRNGHGATAVVRSRVRARRTRFLARFRQTANVRAACAYAGICRDTAYRWKEQDDWFREQWESAIRDFTDLFDMRGKQIAVEGVQEPIVAMGQIVGYKTTFSERFLLRWLERHMPDDWAPVRQESNVRVTGTVGDGAAGSGALSEEARKALTDRVRRLTPVLMARHSAGLKGANGTAPEQAK